MTVLGRCAICVQWNISHKQEWNNVICGNVDGPREYCAKWYKSVKERHIL